LNLLLSCFRASPPPMRLPEVTGRPLPELLAAGVVDPQVFRAGYDIMATRYERLTDRGEIARVQYGINFRQLDGRTYSAPDEPGDGPTGNRGIVMEGATDTEATAIARQTAESCGIFSMEPDKPVHGLAFADAR